MDKLNIAGKFTFTIFIILLQAGCVKMALHFSPSLIPNLTQALFEECDPLLAKQSIPGDLKLMEGLLKHDPNNRYLLTGLCKGFTGYALLFIEDDDPERASSFYFRARTYGLRALGMGNFQSEKRKPEKGFLISSLKDLGEDHIEPIFWAAMSWNAWINLNLDKPNALAQFDLAQLLVDRAMRIKPEYFHGAPYLMKASILSARPKILGGDAEKAKRLFETALEQENRKFLLTHYYFAKYYAVRTQDKKLFFNLLKEISDTKSLELPGACLVNEVVKRKAVQLKEMSDELFF